MRHLKMCGAVLTAMAFVVLNFDFGIQTLIDDGKISVRFLSDADHARRLPGSVSDNLPAKMICDLNDFDESQAGVYTASFGCKEICPTAGIQRCRPVEKTSMREMVYGEILVPIQATKSTLQCPEDQRIAEASAPKVKGVIADTGLVEWVVEHWTEHSNKYKFTVIVKCEEDVDFAKR